MRTINEAGRQSDTRIVGFDASDSLVSGLGEGKVDALVVQDPFAMGWAGVHAVASTWSADEFKSRIDTGCGVITRENMNTPESKRLLDPPIAEYLD